MEEKQYTVKIAEGTLPLQGVIAVIPAYNEDRFIGSVVLKARAYAETVIVVDDGSSDETAVIAERAGAQVVKHERNLGKADAITTGLRRARELNPAAVVMLDADGQHHPQDMLALVQPVLSSQADIVVGSRFLGRKSRIPTWRAVGQHGLTAATNLLSGVPLTDSQSGFRAFSARALDALHFSQKGFTIESEMQFLAREAGLTLAEAPIGVTYAEKSKRNPVFHGVQVLNGVLFLVGQYRPLLFFGVPGMVMLLAGLGLGFRVVKIYQSVQQLAVGFAMITVLLVILGATSLFTGLMLHSVRGLILDNRKSADN